MGVTKFFRYISERYPCLSEAVKQYQIPEFDNLYLDMNGIIHGCSHPNDSDAFFRISEENIFKNIFHYVEILFRMIQPQKLFFLAIDGVAPRAKINQQRSRRFRAAKDAEVQEAKAKAKGVEMPKEKKFDSNCITPGTVFMAKLNEQLRYFIRYKISTDELWQKCKIIFSGSEVPGEGEHKIMDYIRYLKVQPDYDANTRHCLYGLDADLIMLGLCTHQIHFTLLREEVKFGKKQKKILTPEETKFCLLHLSLLRDYIDHEFSAVKDKLPFPYDIEKIIDDWVLMGFLIGNDFIPHLPNLHIAHGALPILSQVYMDVLPSLEGYINESGYLKLDRFEKFMERLSHIDILQFSEHYADLKYFEGKTGRRPNESERHIYKKSEDTCDSVPSPKRTQDKELDALIKSAAVMSIGQFDEDEEGDDESDSDIYNMEFVQHKRDYYMNKLEYENIDADFLRSQAECYVRAIQWNLHYYYHGCCSWSWFYPHHYAPYISDIKDFKDLKLEYELGEPFLPFQQLLAALPAYSKNLLPPAFQSLLTEEHSPIIKYYPSDFKTDLNGKQQEWEAVVLLPFIDEKRLLDAMEPRYPQLTPEERERNKYGPMCLFSYTPESLGVYKAPEYFPDIVSNYATAQLIYREEIAVPRENLITGLQPGAKLLVHYSGFPNLKHIPHTASLEFAKVKVFEQPSQKESMILHITPPKPVELRMVADIMLGMTVYVNWPHLTEAHVVAVSKCDMKISLYNPEMDYSLNNLLEEELKGPLAAQWQLQKKHIIEVHKSRLGIDIGETNILVHARPLCGSKYIFGNQGEVSLKKQWSEQQVAYAYQVVIKDISVFCMYGRSYKTVGDIFVPGSSCFMLGHPHYGAMGKVLESGVCEKSGRIRVLVAVSSEPSLEAIKRLQTDLRTQYMHGSIAAQRLGISSHLLSRITGTIYVKQNANEFQEEAKYNVGLNLKFNKKNEEVPGYTRKVNGQWLYSAKAVELIRNYMVKCPHLFERLAKNVSDDVFQEEKLFNKGTGDLSDTVAWLKEQIHGMESRACGTETVDMCIVQQIEKEIDEHLKTQESEKLVLMQVKPHLLYKPELQVNNLPPDPKAQTRMFDRICCSKKSFTVPIGSKGTVIGIQKAENPLDTMYDVLFDKPFTGGLSISGCSDSRGYRLSAFEFINLTYGEKIEHGKGILDPNAEPVESWRSQANQKGQPCATASAFASIRKENNRLPDFQPPKIRIIKKNEEPCQNKQTSLAPDAYKWKQRNSQSVGRDSKTIPENVVQQNATVRNAKKNQPTMKPTSEFQALWNELHKKQESTTNETSKTPLPTPMASKAKEQVHRDPSENSPQDPSAFLKAMLKISDENVQQTVQSKVSKVPPTNPILDKDEVLDAPPLVQQLFDHARQNEQVKDAKTPIWYCSQLLNHYQFRNVGMPRYSYTRDRESSLIIANICLPDGRVFVGLPSVTHEQAAGSAAKAVYTVLNLSNVRPDVKNLVPPPPQQWFYNRQSNSWLQNIRPPVAPVFPPKPPGLQCLSQWNTKVQQNPGFPNVDVHSNQTNPQTKQAYGPKTEVKNPTSFVPLQAQKKSRNVNAKQGTKDANQRAKDNLQPVAQQRKKESSPKTAKTQSVTTTGEKQVPVQSSSQHMQNKQNMGKPKKSRVAAKFCIPSQAEENHSKNST